MQRLAMVLACGWSTACGQGSGSETVDAAAADATGPGSIDAPAAPRCDPQKPFGAPVPVNELNTPADDEAAYLSADELVVYLSSTRANTLGDFNIFVATRPVRTAPWGSVVPVTGVNTADGDQRRPMVTADGLTMFATIGAAPDREVAIAMRSTAGTAFSSLVAAPAINSSSEDWTGTILPDQSALWLTSNRSGNYELYRATYASGQFGSPAVVGGANVNDAAAEDSAPVVTPDELTLFFGSARAGGLGTQNSTIDIWTARRSKTAEGFGAPENLTVVNTVDDDVPSWISADGCVLYVTRSIGAAHDIHVATRGM